jgi:phosphatidylinositol dimannoside acyltransferase
MMEADEALLTSRVRDPPGRERMLPYYAYRGAESLVGVLPQAVSYWLGDRAADALLATGRHRFDGLRDNLRHVLPGIGNRPLERLVRRNIRNLTHCWVDVMEMSSRRTNLPSRIDIESVEHIEAAMARGNGVVVASMHFGSWEVGLAGWNKMGRKMALLAEVLRPPKLFDRVVGARSTQGVHVIPIDTEAMREGGVQVARRLGAASMREVFKVLRSGGVVAMALDRDLIGNGEPMDFFGQPAPIPIGAVEIAIRAGAAVVPIVLFRDRYRVHAVVYPEIRYAPEQPRDAEVRKTAQVLLRIFERAIREHPEQWHVLDPIWPATGTQ